VYTRKEQTITAARWFFFFRRLFENCKEKQIKTIAIFSIQSRQSSVRQ
jgi:hypothetical protein